MVDVGALTADQLEQATTAYEHARDVLLAHHHAVDLAAKRALVGRCFKHTEALRDDYTVTWPVYIAVTALDGDTLTGWHFQHVPTGQMEIAPDRDLAPGFFATHVEIERPVFIAAFNELLTEIARYANRLP